MAVDQRRPRASTPRSRTCLHENLQPITTAQDSRPVADRGGSARRPSAVLELDQKSHSIVFTVFGLDWINGIHAFQLCALRILSLSQDGTLETKP